MPLSFPIVLRRAEFVLFAAALFLLPRLLVVQSPSFAAQGGGNGGQGASDGTPQLVDMVATDFRFDPESVNVKAGTVRFSMRNAGIIDHNLAIETPQRVVVGDTTLLAPAQTGQFELTLSEGSYVVVCLLSGHREAGMTGMLTVGS